MVLHFEVCFFLGVFIKLTADKESKNNVSGREETQRRGKPVSVH